MNKTLNEEPNNPQTETLAYEEENDIKMFW